MGPALCNIHGVHEYTLTSPLISFAIEQKESLKGVTICTLKIESYGKVFEYYVDYDFLQNIGMPIRNNSIYLKDRNKVIKQLNDRLIILSTVKEMKNVCPICLQESIGVKASP